MAGGGGGKKRFGQEFFRLYDRDHLAHKSVYANDGQSLRQETRPRRDEHDSEGEYYHLVTAWKATIEEQSYAENA